MKVLQINCWFGEGSTGKIVCAIHDYIKKQNDEAYVIYGIGDRIPDTHMVRTTPKFVRKMQSLRSRITGYPYGGCIWGTKTAISYIKKIRPDVVHIHCINGYMVNIYKVLTYLKINHIPTVLTNHAEFMYTGGCTHAIECEKWKTGCFSCPKIGKEHPISYFFDHTAKEWKLMKEAYKGFDKLYVCNVSDWVSARAKKSPFYEGYPVVTIFNGLNTEIFHYKGIRHDLKSQYNAERKKIVIHVTPSFSEKIKGGEHVLEMAKRFPEVIFLVVGDSSGVRKNLSNVEFLGRVASQEQLADLYSLADVCLLTSLRETFSMVTAESLCCGTPVVGFKAGGPESIALQDYSIFVEQADDAALEEALRKMLFRRKKSSEISRIACEKYSEKTMCEEYYLIYKKLVDDRIVSFR